MDPKRKHREYMRTWYRKHIKEMRERDKIRRLHPKRISWRKAWDAKPVNRTSAKKRARKWYKLNRTRARIAMRAQMLRKKFGITIEQYEELYRKQKGKCGICKRHAKQFEKRLAVDHDHNTGKIRGLLCGVCNSYLGRINDSPKAILEYFGLG